MCSANPSAQSGASRSWKLSMDASGEGVSWRMRAEAEIRCPEPRTRTRSTGCSSQGTGPGGVRDGRAGHSHRAFHPPPARVSLPPPAVTPQKVPRGWLMSPGGVQWQRQVRGQQVVTQGAQCQRRRRPPGDPAACGGLGRPLRLGLERAPPPGATPRGSQVGNVFFKPRSAEEARSPGWHGCCLSDPGSSPGPGSAAVLTSVSLPSALIKRLCTPERPWTASSHSLCRALPLPPDVRQAQNSDRGQALRPEGPAPPPPR